mmetsp:Transcript_41966/g.164463  ORF Transcript_41966/g.164463 Transcript_41966/m.164463 type:complete len:132 (+) Transcript_41966:270-665(+)
MSCSRSPQQWTDGSRSAFKTCMQVDFELVVDEQSDHLAGLGDRIAAATVLSLKMHQKLESCLSRVQSFKHSFNRGQLGLERVWGNLRLWSWLELISVVLVFVVQAAFLTFKFGRSSVRNKLSRTPAHRTSL